MRVYLYKCDNCGNAQFREIDAGEIYYVSCVRCGTTFHHKVVVRSVVYDEYIFEQLKGEKDDSEEEIDVD